MEQTFDTLKAAQAQREYVKENKLPHFAPGDGQCWACHQNIFEPVERVNSFNNKPYIRGISVEEAAMGLITGCPHCNRSYCD